MSSKNRDEDQVNAQYSPFGRRFCRPRHPRILAHALTYLCRGKAEGEGNNIGDFISGNGTSIWQKCNIARAVSNDQLGIIRAWLKKGQYRNNNS